MIENQRSSWYSSDPNKYRNITLEYLKLKGNISNTIIVIIEIYTQVSGSLRSK
jgi:hypothetical protein